MKEQFEERQPGDILPAGFDPHQAISILGDYIRDLENSFDELRKTSLTEKKQIETDLRTFTKIKDDQQQEIERLTHDLLELTTALEESESSLVSANQKSITYENQLKKLHRDHADLQGRFTQKENDANFYKQELDHQLQELETSVSTISSLNKRIEEMERRLATERNSGLDHEKEVRRLTLDISECQGKIKLMQKKIDDGTNKYNEEIKRLSERMLTDAQHEANLLKKRVRSSVAPEMRDLEKIFSEKLSIEVASNLKALLSRMVSKLEQEGLELTPEK